MEKVNKYNRDWAEIFYYDETSPSCLRWNTTITSGQGKINCHKGKAAGNISPLGYYCVGYRGINYLAHRIVWVLLRGYISHNIDHVDGDSSNNTIINLEEKNQRANCMNSKMNTNNTSGVTGVRYRCNILVSGKVQDYWVGFIRDINSKTVEKSFSIEKLGSEAAFSKACNWRKHQIELMNSEWAVYTERHGT